MKHYIILALENKHKIRAVSKVFSLYMHINLITTKTLTNIHHPTKENVKECIV